jgi:adenylosuccinate lyase
VLRNMGVALGYTVLAHSSLRVGMGKLEVDRQALAADLDAAPQVLAEAVQTVMRRHGLAEPYERLKEFTRGRAVTLAAMHEFIDTLTELPEAERQRLKALTPATYTGLAASLARKA